MPAASIILGINNRILKEPCKNNAGIIGQIDVVV